MIEVVSATRLSSADFWNTAALGISLRPLAHEMRLVFYLADRVTDGLRTFDVIGVAGNRRRVRGQPVWAFIDDTFTWDTAANLSGSVAHGNDPCGAISVFGTVPAECELLDGVLLAATKSRLSAAMFGSAGWNEGRRLYRRASLDADILGRRLAAAAATELREMGRASQRGPRD